jgi:hypothetical protein
LKKAPRRNGRAGNPSKDRSVHEGCQSIGLNQRRRKTFTSVKDKESWTVANPEAVKGHEGHEVSQGPCRRGEDEIHVVSVKVGKGEMKDTMKKEEMHK